MKEHNSFSPHQLSIFFLVSVCMVLFFYFFTSDTRKRSSEAQMRQYALEKFVFKVNSKNMRHMDV